MNQPVAAVVMPTRNRRDFLREAIRSAQMQDVPVEIIVMDDASTDDTPRMMREEFPMVQYHRSETPQGPAILRNRGVELSRAPVAFPIDDDSVFATPGIISQTLKDFDHPRVGAVGIPYINVRQDKIVRQRAPHRSGVYVISEFLGASHAVRRDLFLALGGLPVNFFMAGEEGYYCQRLLDAGYVTRLGNSEPIHHHESPIRNTKRVDFLGRRNDVLYAWHNVPGRHFPLHLAGTTWNGVRFALGSQRPFTGMGGLMRGYVDCLKYWNLRKPVSPIAYQLFRRLKYNPGLPLSEIEAELPPMLKLD